MKIQELYNTTWKKCVLIFLVVFFVMIILSAFAIGGINDTMRQNGIHSETVTIQDKVVGDAEKYKGNYYMVMGDNNKTYSINGDNAKDIFDKIKVNQKYRLTVDEPDGGTFEFIEILQVHNATS